MGKAALWGFCLILVVPGLFSCDNGGGDSGEYTLILENSSGFSSVACYWGYSSGTSEPGQSFILAEAAAVKKISVKVGGSEGSPTGSYGIQIRNDDGSGEQPAATARASSMIKSASEINTSGAWNEFVFDTAVNLDAGELYWIVCTTTESAGSNYFNLYYSTTSDQYSDGWLGLFGDGTWYDSIFSKENDDLHFRIYKYE
jgi:hypothetical protein